MNGIGEAVFKEGRAEGIIEGKAEGIIEGVAKVAKKLLDSNYSIDEVMDLTDLSKEEIEKL